jgi:hypothetical protein
MSKYFYGINNIVLHTPLKESDRLSQKRELGEK